MPISIKRVIEPAASLVCSVESTRWPVRAASIAICAVSRSRISPTMITSGSARTIARSPVANVSPALGLTWIWVIPSSWYSTGSSIVTMCCSGVLATLERGVQRGRLARAGRPGHEHGAVGLRIGAMEAVQLGLRHAELGEVHHDRFLVEDAHDHALAAHRRHGDDAQVDAVAVDGQPDAAVLRQAPLGDVELGHDLHARDDAGGHPPRDRVDVAQHAVDAEAHAQVLALRRDVKVGGALLDGLPDELVDELDDRRVVGGLVQLDDRASRVARLVVGPSRATSPTRERREITAAMSSLVATATRTS